MFEGALGLSSRKTVVWHIWLARRMFCFVCDRLSLYTAGCPGASFPCSSRYPHTLSSPFAQPPLYQDYRHVITTTSICKCFLNQRLHRIYRCDPSYAGIDEMCIRAELIQGSNICMRVFILKLVVLGLEHRPCACWASAAPLNSPSHFKNIFMLNQGLIKLSMLALQCLVKVTF